MSLIDVAKPPINAVVRGRYNAYFGDEAFNNPKIRRQPPISHVSSTNGDRTVFLENGASIPDVDHIIFGTGFTWTVPFLPDIVTRNNRVPNLYLHVFYQRDPTLVFVGAVRLFSLQSIPLPTDELLGWCRSDFQGFRMASRPSRTCLGRKGETSTRGGTDKMGG